jgi:outer membrane lipoprotein carrier protein
MLPAIEAARPGNRPYVGDGEARTMRGLAKLPWSRFSRALLIGLSVLLLGSAAPCSAGTAAPHGANGAGSLPSTVDAIQHHYQTTDSFSAKFVEEITPVGAPKRTREGLVYFRKPGRMRWEFKTPNAELVVSDGQTLYSYDPGLNQVVESPLSRALRAPGATEFLLGAGNIKHDFTASTPPSAPSDGLEHVRLTPRKGGEAIEVAVDPNSHDIRAIRITDELGDATEVRFSDIRNNVSLQDSLFSFQPPPGADIVRPAAP